MRSSRPRITALRNDSDPIDIRRIRRASTQPTDLNRIRPVHIEPTQPNQETLRDILVPVVPRQWKQDTLPRFAIHADTRTPGVLIIGAGAEREAHLAVDVVEADILGGLRCANVAEGEGTAVADIAYFRRAGAA